MRRTYKPAKKHCEKRFRIASTMSLTGMRERCSRRYKMPLHFMLRSPLSPPLPAMPFSTNWIDIWHTGCPNSLERYGHHARSLPSSLAQAFRIPEAKTPMACHSVERRSNNICPVCNLSYETSWRWGQWVHIIGLRWAINVMCRCSLCGTRRRDLDFWHYERWGRDQHYRWTVYLGPGW